MEIKANGIQVSYEVSGKKDGPVVMLSHSLGSGLVMWHPQAVAQVKKTTAELTGEGA